MEAPKCHIAVDTDGRLLMVNLTPANISGFKVLPRRWVIERTFGWMAASAQPTLLWN